MRTNPHNPGPHNRRYSLTLTQRNAIDLLLAGKNDRQVSEQLGVERSTVTRWRLYDSQFQVALDRRRAQVWPAANDHARSLLPTALATMDEQLRVGPNRGRLALDYVFRAGLLGKPYSGDLATAGIGPTSLQERLDQEVLRHRATTRAATPTGDTAEEDDTPITQEERDAASARLAARLAEPDPEDPDDAPSSTPKSATNGATNGATPSASTRAMSSFR
jgi:hypothetical protein